jgi:hypothetical protein
MPISVNRMIQINPMVEPDGVKGGLIRVGYHSATDPAVNAEPITPAIWHMIIKCFGIFLHDQHDYRFQHDPNVLSSRRGKGQNVFRVAQVKLAGRFPVYREDRPIRLKRNILLQADADLAASVAKGLGL